jgi:hypothetical protein
MTHFEYLGVAYRQNKSSEAPWLVSYVVAAEELLEWAGIPRRATPGLVGFQRTYDEARVMQAKKFFDLAPNQSPTALVVGIHPIAPSGNRPVKLEFLDGDETSMVRKCRLVVEFNPDHMSLDRVIESVRHQIHYRLDQDILNAGPSSALSSPTDITDEEDSAEEAAEEAVRASETDDEEDEALEGEDHSGEALELGRSLLNELLVHLDDRDWCAAHLDDLRDLAKPATIIDGQHRVLGARACERNIPFAVCAMYDCDWAEQVFQFTVVNYTAEGIPDQFITANAALSLTKPELGKLQTRLVQAGVKVIEYELMKVVQFDVSSPFHNLVNLSEKKDPKKIGYKTMVRLAKRWYDGRHQVFQLLFAQMFPDLRGRKNRRKRLELWRAEYWGTFFLDFWSVVHRRYNSEPANEPGYNLWDVGHSNLIVAIVLLEFQEAYLDNLNAQDEEFFQPKDSHNAVAELRDKLRKRAEKFVEWVPPQFFGTRWGWSGLSIGPGRSALKEALGKFVTNKGIYQYDKSALITGKTER